MGFRAQRYWRVLGDVLGGKKRSDRGRREPQPTNRASSLLPRLERWRAPGLKPARDLLVRDGGLTGLDGGPLAVQLGKLPGIRRNLGIDEGDEVRHHLPDGHTACRRLRLQNFGRV